MKRRRELFVLVLLVVLYMCSFDFSTKKTLRIANARHSYIFAKNESLEEERGRQNVPAVDTMEDSPELQAEEETNQDDQISSLAEGESKVSDSLSDGFHDQTFFPLLEAYLEAEERKPPLVKFRNGSVPRFLIWSKPFRMNFWKAQLADVSEGICPLPCEFTTDLRQKDSVDAIVVYLRGAPSRSYVMEALGPRDPRQPWVVLTFEAPPRANSNHKTNYREFDGVFNRTMLYRKDSDVVVPHGFVVRQGREAQVLPEEWRFPHPREQMNQTRRTVVAFISNCRDTSGRLKYVRALEKLIDVDVYGQCGSLRCGHSMYVEHKYHPSRDKCLRLAGEGYLFFIAFENSLCTDYVTEKLYNALFYPIVPIVLGAIDYSTLLPPNSYINARDYTPQEMAQKLQYLAQNPSEYQKYLEWRKFYQPSTMGGERTLCHLCVRLHDPAFYQHKVIDDFYDWFVTKSHCDERLNTTSWTTPSR